METYISKLQRLTTEVEQKTHLEIEFAGAPIHEEEELEPVGLDDGWIDAGIIRARCWLKIIL